MPSSYINPLIHIDLMMNRAFASLRPQDAVGRPFSFTSEDGPDIQTIYGTIMAVEVLPSFLVCTVSAPRLRGKRLEGIGFDGRMWFARIETPFGLKVVYGTFNLI